MRFLILLGGVGVLLVGAAFNVNALCDAAIALYQNSAAREVYAAGLALVGVAVLVLALVLASHRAYRQLDRDFPQSWNDRR